MSETNEFVSLGINIGPARFTVSAKDVPSLVSVVAQVLEVDETDPDGLSPINYLVDSVETIQKAVEVKFAMSAPSAAKNATAPSANPQASAPTCRHGTMKWKTGTNAAGKDYEGYFCQAPFGSPDKCPKHSSFRYLN